LIASPEPFAATILALFNFNFKQSGGGQSGGQGQSSGGQGGGSTSSGATSVLDTICNPVGENAGANLALSALFPMSVLLIFVALYLTGRYAPKCHLLDRIQDRLKVFLFNPFSWCGCRDGRCSRLCGGEEDEDGPRAMAVLFKQQNLERYVGLVG
jgi:hypothetical protein